MLANYGYMDHLTGFAKADTASQMALELDPNNTYLIYLKGANEQDRNTVMDESEVFFTN